MLNKPPIIPALDTLMYTALFCEENIFFLGQALVEAGFNVSSMQVWFLSNANKQIPLRCQKSQADNADYVLWDYHVILQLNYAQQDWILDFDSRLAFPILSNDYFQQTLIPRAKLKPEFQVYARKIPLADYLQQFSSSREHMCDENGQPLAVFPSYPPIVANNISTRVDLQSYLDMQLDIKNSLVQML